MAEKTDWALDMIAILASASVLMLALQPVTTMEQIGSDDGAAANSTVTIAVNPLQDVPRPDGPDATNVKTQVYDQLSAESGLGAPSPQLTDTSSSGPVHQLSRRDRNTQSTPSLSERRQGFDTATVKLEGTDRCSAELISANDRELCDRVIENRSTEFRGPQPTKLSPEQKLLGERDFDLVLRGPEGAARRLAKSQNTADDADNQAIASLVLNNPPPDREQAGPGDDAADIGSETQALIDAIVSTVAAPR